MQHAARQRVFSNPLMNANVMTVFVAGCLLLLLMGAQVANACPHPPSWAWPAALCGAT